MKTTRLLFIFVLITALFAIVPSASAVLTTYTSGFQVQNLEGDTANVTLYFYRQNGTQPPGTPISDTIAANDSKNYYPLTVETGFNGSVVVASDNQVAAITNVLSTDMRARGSYTASSSGSTSVFIPLLMKFNGLLSTWFNVQNTGGSAATITATYTSGPPVTSPLVQPGASYTFDQTTETHPSPIFAGTVTCAQPVAVTVIEEKPNVLFAYSGFTTGSTSVLPVMPLINANNGLWKTGLMIYNTGGTATNVTVSYTPADPPVGAGTACQETQTIPAGLSGNFALYAFATGANSNCVALAKFVGSAKVTTNSAGHQLAAIVNQTTPSRGGTYNAFNAASATAKVVFPLIMDRNNGWSTGINVMNVGAVVTTITCHFTAACSGYAPTKELQPGESFSDIQTNKCVNGYVGAGYCTSTGSVPIVGIVNENKAGTYDNALTFEAVNTTP